MNELADSDWTLINAYHDGELGQAEARDLESRMARDPALVRALNQVRHVSASLAALRPESRAEVFRRDFAAANARRFPRRWLAGAAAAAAVAVAIVFGSGFLAEPTPIRIHAAFMDQSFAVGDRDLRTIAGKDPWGVPDLSGANLVPVAVASFEAGQVTHYAGRNGCRLSYFRGSFRNGDDDRAAGQQVASWTTNADLRHMVVATGMDRARFDAVVAYLQQVTRQGATESVLASLTQATRNASACLG